MVHLCLYTFYGEGGFCSFSVVGSISNQELLKMY